jgi:hypothetical protein
MIGLQLAVQGATAIEGKRNGALRKVTTLLE